MKKLVPMFILEDETFIFWGSGYATETNAPPHWHIDNGGPWASYSAYEDVLTDGNMHHYAITYNATDEEMSMYLDYGLIATVDANLSDAVAADDPGALFIGSHMGSSSSEVWNGLIDRIRFSDNVVETADFIPNPNAVPVPGAVWLLGSGLISLMAVRQRRGKE